MPPDLIFSSAVSVQRQRLTLQDSLPSVMTDSLRVSQYIGNHKLFVADLNVPSRDIRDFTD